MKFADARSAAPRALLLALVGFVFSVLAIVFFFFCATRLGVVKPSSPLGWILCGAIVGGASSLVIKLTLAGGSVDTRVAHVLEVESAGTDALCIVVTMVIIDFMTSDTVDLSRPFLALGREIGLGAGFGVIAGVAFLLIMPRLHGRHHNYTFFLATMLVLYSLTDYANGNGAVAVLGCGMIVGNANSIRSTSAAAPGSMTGARDANAEAIGRNMTFIIKSFSSRSSA
jgi:cell volume regulation protein A